ncbi:hypothetical protein CU098_013511 [Rhizopus stolonifer]|uniref:Uncharacterized protein n=1 Tax=Rhizopus stolonifer TaxID=4846 RepID=A0A367KTR1_RHIST|nr:hypothetical protein CU098_013511 [Rhizopus stolonifer]
MLSNNQQQWPTYSQPNATPTANAQQAAYNQQYAAYYQQYPAQPQNAYYPQYYSFNPPPPGTAGTAGTAGASATPGYSQYGGGYYYQGNPNTSAPTQQAAPYYPPAPQHQYQQHQYNQPPQIYQPVAPARPPPPPPLSQTTPVLTGKVAPKVPPWSKKELEIPRPPAAPFPQVVQQQQMPQLEKAPKSSQNRATEVSPAESWPPSLK